jgi:hypothetical protein
MAVIRIGRISFTTADADRLGAFYRQAFGFERWRLSTTRARRLRDCDCPRLQAPSLRSRFVIRRGIRSNC